MRSSRAILTLGAAVGLLTGAPSGAHAIGQCVCDAGDAYLIPGFTRMLPTNPQIFGSLRGVDPISLRFEDAAGNKVAAVTTPAAGGAAHEFWIKPATPLALGQTYFLKGTRLPGSAGFPSEFSAYYQTSKPDGVAGDGADTTPPTIGAATIAAGTDPASCAANDGLFGAFVQLASYNDDFAVGAQTVWQVELSSAQGPVGSVFLAGDGFRTPMGHPFFGSTTVLPAAMAADCVGDARLAAAMAGGTYTAKITVYDWAGNTAVANAPAKLSGATAAVQPDGGAPLGGAGGGSVAGVDGGAPVKQDGGGGCSAAPGRPAAATGISLAIALLIASRRRRRV